MTILMAQANLDAITGKEFPLPDPSVPVLERIRGNLARFF